MTATANNLISFSLDQSFNVRVVMRDGDPWFVAADVCEALGLDPTAIRELDEDEKGLHSMQPWRRSRARRHQHIWPLHPHPV